MDVIKIEQDFEDAITKAVACMRSEGVVIYPTDTIYGLGADAFSDNAVDRVYSLKGRDAQKPIHCIVADLASAAEYAEINEAARVIAKKFLPGPLTLVLNKKPGVEGGIARGMDTIGIRIPDNEFCIALAKAFEKPYTTTSANKAGEEPSHLFEDVIASIGEADLAIDGGDAPRAKPSTVVDLTSGSPVVLREGAVPAADILALF